MLQLIFIHRHIVGPSEGSRESSAAWPSAAAHIENSATTQRLMKVFHMRYLQMVRPKDKLRLRAPCHAEPVYQLISPSEGSHDLSAAASPRLSRRLVIKNSSQLSLHLTFG
jgi:hypothetical protein